MENELTPEGEIILKALEVHRLHLEDNECGQCIASYETMLSAITAWVESESQKEEQHGKQEEGGKEKSGGQKGQAEGQKPKKEIWDIFE